MDDLYWILIPQFVRSRPGAIRRVVVDDDQLGVDVVTRGENPEDLLGQKGHILAFVVRRCDDGDLDGIRHGVRPVSSSLRS